MNMVCLLLPKKL